MREILFRGKTIGSDESIPDTWVYGDLINLHDGRKYIVNNNFGACIDGNGNFINTESPFVCEVKPDTVGQYTGISTKDGQRVFEDDIINTPKYGREGNRGGNFSGADTFCIKYEIGGYCLNNARRRFNLRGDVDMRIIGNIHDSPELLQRNET